MCGPMLQSNEKYFLIKQVIAAILFDYQLSAVPSPLQHINPHKTALQFLKKVQKN